MRGIENADNMDKKSKKEANLCIAVFALCLTARFIEYFIIRTDQTTIGENVFHKAFGIILLAVVLKSIHLKWSDIGFQRKNFANNILNGLLLGSICFAVSYAAELAILSLQGSPGHLALYISGFSLTGSQSENIGFLPLILCILFNMINVWMEEGVFRGLFIKLLTDTETFPKANIFAALLFGIWHIVMPVRSYIDSEMTFFTMLFMCAGYIMFSGLMSVKWGLLYRMTGNIWTGLGDHLLNNTVATNILHVVTVSGHDELQIIRIILAQIISFIFVLAVYKKRPNQ